MTPPRPGRPSRPAAPPAVALVVAVLAVVALATSLSTAVLWRPEGGPGPSGGAVATASSAVHGHAAHDAVRPVGGTDRPAGWRSAGETLGAWWEQVWPHPVPVHRVTLVRNPVTEPGLRAGVLSFGDGSALQVRFADGADRVDLPVTPRTVDRVRFTIAAADPGATDVRLDRVEVSTGPDAAGVDPEPGDAVPGGSITAPGGGAALADGDGTPSGTGAVWTAPGAARPVTTTVTWSGPRELTSVELVGAAGTAGVGSGTITFGDGATLPLGAVLPDPARPTLVAFLPRVTTSLRLDLLPGAGPVALADLRAHTLGATPPRPVPAAGPSPPPTGATGTGCTGPARPTGGIAVRCPLPGTVLTGRSVRVEVVVPPGHSRAAAAVWPADPAVPAGPTVVAPPDARGTAVLDVPLEGVPPGPLTLHLEATGPGRAPSALEVTLSRAGPDPGPAPPGTPAAGRTLVWAEEFDGPPSVSRSGADTVYSGAKPVHDGVQDFGDAVFSDGVHVVDGVLRIDVAPLPPGTADPQGWGRRHSGGLVASARPGGSGFAAQYGYFEARMLAPGLPGTWPAFWALPTDNLVAPTPAVAEVDVVELYGHDPLGACHTVHDHRLEPTDDGGGGVSDCGRRFAPGRSAMAWHTYGAAVSPTDITFFVDDRVVATAPQVAGGGAPLFFLVDLALGGGWPVELGPTGERAALYVDHVRVYV